LELEQEEGFVRPQEKAPRSSAVNLGDSTALEEDEEEEEDDLPGDNFCDKIVSAMQFLLLIHNI
jgi:hypothetical protein